MPQIKSNQPPKPHARLERWTWALIYGGIFLVILGLATGRVDEALGWMLATPGAVLAVVGVLLIYLRSRLPEEKS